MEEIMKKMLEDIELIKREQNDLEKLNEKNDLAREELKEAQEEKNSISDKNSGFYKDLEQKVNEKQRSFTEINNQRMQKQRDIEEMFINKKSEIIEKLEELKKYVDEHRNDDLNAENEEVNELKEQKEHYEKLVEEDRKNGLSDKVAIQYLRLRKIAQIDAELKKYEEIDLYKNYLDGADPKDKYIEISNFIDDVNKNYTLDNMEDFYKSIVDERDIDNAPELEPEIKPEQEQEPNQEIQPEIEPEIEPESDEPNIEENSESEPPPQQQEIVSNQETISEQNQGTEPEIEPEIEPETEPESEPNPDPNPDPNPNPDPEHDLRIVYNAEYKSYQLINETTKEVEYYYEDDIEPYLLGRETLQYYYDISDATIMNIDPHVVTILNNYCTENGFDESRVERYIQEMAKVGLNKDDRQKQMEDLHLKLEYNLKGLYDKIKTKDGKKEYYYTAEERRNILDIANNAKVIGLANVNKGNKVKIKEFFEKISTKIHFRNALPEALKSRKQKEWDKLVNKDEMEQLNEDFERDKRRSLSERKKEKRKIKNKARSAKKKKIFSKIRNKFIKKEDKEETFYDRMRVDSETQEKLRGVSERANEQMNNPDAHRVAEGEYEEIAPDENNYHDYPDVENDL